MEPDTTSPALQTYCMFIGYPFSGDSLVGALLDAHPNIVIAHEADAFRLLDDGLSREQIFEQLIDNSRRSRERGRTAHGESYAVANQWQGRYRELHVIGDKKAGAASVRLGREQHLLDTLRERVRLPVKLVHVIRNPYDTIATLAGSEGRVVPGTLTMYFGMAKTVSELKARLPPADVHDVRYEDLAADPRRHLTALCRFLGEETTADYLDACTAIVGTTTHARGARVAWPPELVARARDRMEEFPFFAGYTLDDGEAHRPVTPRPSPAAATTKKFCVLTVGRSASSSLVRSLLRFDDIALPNRDVEPPNSELLHPGHMKSYARRYAALCGAPIASHGELIDGFFRYNAGYRYAGFKSMPDRHPDLEAFVHREDIQFITLVREDIPSTAASFMVALTTGSWRRAGGPQAKWTFRLAEHGPRLLGNVAYIHRSHAQLAAIPGAIHLTYEELCRPDFRCGALDEFFARPIRLETPRPPTTGVSYVENWDEFRHFVETALRELATQR